ncbi:hypothetical protein MNO14_08630 [Luteimonas sp. S4-F44]|uniref:hypothetical protein n=1 Tax=Luteimonas sp. S4-F44 TaxID=2925842 RepID=UPI001F5363BD|nr:hypothetical protein [Luteimonas sp. S4-F44]UNK41057.1 hypothetical protein MNO14_08630 [Luteimonas sp. S4-F44]
MRNAAARLDIKIDARDKDRIARAAALLLRPLLSDSACRYLHIARAATGRAA